MTHRTDSIVVAKKKLLLVEDDLDIILVFSKLLSNNFEVSVASTESEFMRKVKEQKFDCILLDIYIEGISVTTTLKNLDKEIMSKIIIFSNFQNNEIKKQLQRIGVTKFLPKLQFTEQKLLELITK